jgi:glycosyltransferase involved in cell wall biosynthesis
VCIATLNRAAYIGATLESIVSQATEQVELVIVDGASTDNTEEIVKEYARRFPRLRYHRLAAKGGVDQDYSRAVELASGEYCWLFTDDDILKSGAIGAVLAEISRGHGLIVVNAEVRNVDLSEVLQERFVKAKSDRVYGSSDWERFFVDGVPYLSFIGGVVIKRDVWAARDKESYYGTVFVHVGVICQAPIPGGVVILAEPRISIRYGNAQWASRSFEICLFKWPTLVWSFSGVSDSAKRQVIGRTPWDSMTALLTYRARGAYSSREYKELVEARLTPSLRRLMARAIAAAPGPLLNLCLVAYLSVFGRFHSQPRIRLVDLRASRFYYKRLLIELIARVRRGRR